MTTVAFMRNDSPGRKERTTPDTRGSIDMSTKRRLGSGRVSPLRLPKLFTPSGGGSLCTAGDKSPAPLGSGFLVGLGSAHDTPPASCSPSDTADEPPSPTKWKSKSLSLKIPGFRRESSFVGKTEGFELYEDLFSPSMQDKPHFAALASPPAARASIAGLNLPTPSGMPEIQLDRFDWDAADTPPRRTEPDSPVSEQPGCRAFEGMDFSTDTRVQGDLLLGALPVLPRSPVLANPSVFWNRMKKVHVYSKRERRGLIQRYRAKKRRRHFKKRIRYACRQAFAQSRPRIGGRFCNKEELTVIRATPALAQKMAKGENIDIKEVNAAREALKAAGGGVIKPMEVATTSGNKRAASAPVGGIKSSKQPKKSRKVRRSSSPGTSARKSSLSSR